MNKDFTNVIYANRKQLKNLQLLKEAYCWPEFVWVMDSSYKLNDTYYHHATNNPGNMYGWAEYMFRSINPLTCSVADIVHCLRLWWGIHEQILTHFIGKPIPPAHTIFNTVWALLGYTEDQDKKALDLAIALMSSPIFNDSSISKTLPKPGMDISNAKKETIRTSPHRRTPPTKKSPARINGQSKPPRRNARTR